MEVYFLQGPLYLGSTDVEGHDSKEVGIWPCSLPMPPFFCYAITESHDALLSTGFKMKPIMFIIEHGSY